LAGEGVSVRRIAEQVFGEARFRGRVERILRGKPDTDDAVQAAQLRAAQVAEFMALPRTEQLRRLLERRFEELFLRDTATSARELLSLLAVDRQIRNLETVERLNAF
jgi:hypothetical protein